MLPSTRSFTHSLTHPARSSGRLLRARCCSEHQVHNMVNSPRPGGADIRWRKPGQKDEQVIYVTSSDLCQKVRITMETPSERGRVGAGRLHFKQGGQGRAWRHRGQRPCQGGENRADAPGQEQSPGSHEDTDGHGARVRRVNNTCACFQGHPGCRAENRLRWGGQNRGDGTGDEGRGPAEPPRAQARTGPSPRQCGPHPQGAPQTACPRPAPPPPPAVRSRAPRRPAGPVPQSPRRRLE